MPTAPPGKPYSVAPSFQITLRPPNIKSLECERIDAKIRYTIEGLGFGFKDFKRRWKHAIATDIAIYGIKCTEFLEMMLMVKFMAARPAKLRSTASTKPGSLRIIYSLTRIEIKTILNGTDVAGVDPNSSTG